MGDNLYKLKVIDKNGNVEADEVVAERKVERALIVILEHFLDDIPPKKVVIEEVE